MAVRLELSRTRCTGYGYGQAVMWRRPSTELRRHLADLAVQLALVYRRYDVASARCHPSPGRRHCQLKLARRARGPLPAIGNVSLRVSLDGGVLNSDSRVPHFRYYLRAVKDCQWLAMYL